MIPQDASFSITGSAAVGTDLTLGGLSVYSLLPFYRMTLNQTLEPIPGGGADTIADWEPNGDPQCGVALQFVQKVSKFLPWANRSAEEKALLTAMGRPNVDYLFSDFNIYRVSWTGANCWTLGQRVPTQPHFTVAAFTKLESGALSGNYAFWANGATDTWSLTGQHVEPNAEGYLSAPPYTATEAGSLLFALPAVVVGWVDLSKSLNWGWFPYASPEPSSDSSPCPDPVAKKAAGFCIWHYDGGDKTYHAAAALCKAQGGRLCTRAEISAAQVAGAEWCSNNWVADRLNNTVAYTAFPMQTVNPNCGGEIGVIEATVPMTNTTGANCCR